jgi:hypothetical protein
MVLNTNSTDYEKYKLAKKNVKKQINTLNQVEHLKEELNDTNKQFEHIKDELREIKELLTRLVECQSQ